MPGTPVLAIDLGGTKLAAALVDRREVLDRRQEAITREGGASTWLDAVERLVAGWDGYRTAGVAVTGVVTDGRWRALNPGILPVPDDFPLEAELRRRLGVPVLVRNDGQSAAWGEARHGAGQGGSLVFVTVSTGVGGGLVANGRLVEGRAGLAGHLGITPVETADGVRMLEEIASGTALTRLAGDRGGAAAVTDAALRGEAWAGTLLDRVVAPLALALRRLQLLFDPDRIIIGGGLGLAPGYLDRLRRHCEAAPPLIRPTICAAALGADAGLIGIADLAASHSSAGG